MYRTLIDHIHTNLPCARDSESDVEEPIPKKTKFNKMQIKPFTPFKTGASTIPEIPKARTSSLPPLPPMPSRPLDPLVDPVLQDMPDDTQDTDDMSVDALITALNDRIVQRSISPPPSAQSVTSSLGMVMPAQSTAADLVGPSIPGRKPASSSNLEIPAWLKKRKAGEMQTMLKQLRQEQEAQNVDIKDLVATGVAPASEYHKRIMRKQVSFDRARVSFSYDSSYRADIVSRSSGTTKATGGPDSGCKEFLVGCTHTLPEQYLFTDTIFVQRQHRLSIK